ncbi:DOMON-like domain-containing protein [Sulfurisoma sediminicola]|uniref:DOMON-like domain-containing protein n=1 Tax=Sulfurisoma sediminicola TaxID=1381557 RepID=A0A497XJQ6_9PROT|nr:DOMON-like domain-containing protein [Sulfurisoma sediminicola]RLJ67590.1 hypothetical protein DFR35_0137 [Sulfurisoma sediminicola]
MGVTLAPHPDNPAGLQHEVDATLTRRPDGVLAVAYSIRGDMSALHVPTPMAPASADALWRTTCCELFVAAGEKGYREFNFSPSGQWAVYDFADYRERAPVPPDCPAPTITRRIDETALRVDVELPAAALPAGELRLGISAILETRDGEIGYWALAHAPGRPDFHYATAFALAFEKDPA